MEALLLLWLTILFFGTVTGNPGPLLWGILVAAGVTSVVATGNANWLLGLLVLLAFLLLLKQWARR